MKHNNNNTVKLTKREKALLILMMVWALIPKLSPAGLFMGCKNSVSPEKDEPCECTTKDHLGVGEDCCKASDCGCELKVYGTIEDALRNMKVPVYRKGGVSGDKMLEAIEKAQDAYASLGASRRDALPSKWLAVYITTGNSTARITIGEGAERKYILEFGENAQQNWMENMMAALAEDINAGHAQARPANGARMVAAPAAKQLQKIRS